MDLVVIKKPIQTSDIIPCYTYKTQCSLLINIILYIHNKTKTRFKPPCIYGFFAKLYIIYIISFQYSKFGNMWTSENDIDKICKILKVLMQNVCSEKKIRLCCALV